ncbi:MAG: PAS domain-containing sensor histidine kinase [Citrobacter freundii]|nr:MAG: PAS domain-containing sensor histidine kinase [Citrobacter freundii]
MDANPQSNQLFLSGPTEKDQSLLLLALDASISGIIITDNHLPDNPIVYCNKAFEKMSGFDKAEIIGRNCRFLQGNDRDQPQITELRDAVRNGKALTVVLRNYRKDGELFWNELYMSPVDGNDGSVRYFIGVQNDVTRRKLAEEEVLDQQAHLEERIEERTRQLSESEEYLNSIIETVRESLLVLDRELNVLSANRSFFRTFEVDEGETVGRKLYDLGNGQWNIPTLRALLEQVLPTNNPVLDFEVQYDFPHIGQKQMLLNAYQVEHQGLYKDRILLAIEDITIRKTAERRKDDFLSVASHELKTPLTVIKGYHDLLLGFDEKDISPRGRRILEKAAKSSDRLHRLVLTLLDVSKIQSGNLELQTESLLLDDVVREAIELFGPTLDKSHEFRVEGQTTHLIPGDRERLLQVMSNLLGNAVKYSPGKPVVKINLSETDTMIKCSVSDLGVGVSKDDQPMLFDRFFRASAHKQLFPGMGMGLFICQQVIAAHHGKIWIEESNHQGTTFSFIIPFKQS